MQAGVGLLVTDVMPIYMIMPRYSHNYSLFYQLLDSNLFTHRNTYAILREATSETYGPRVYLLSYKLSIYIYLHLYFSNLYHKIPKIYLSSHTILREATSETYGPGSIFHHINLPTLSYFHCFLFCFYFTLHLYHKNTKNIILSYLSDLTLVSDREGIDNPLSRWLRVLCLFV